MKIQQYSKYAKDILSKKEIDVSKDFTPEQTGYVYSYIEYYIEHENRNKKFEKMRALYGMSKSLFCCMFFVLALCIIGCTPIVNNEYLIGHKKAILIIIYAIISTFVYYFRARRCMYYRIRMMMGVYEACIEAEKRERTIQNEKIN